MIPALGSIGAPSLSPTNCKGIVGVKGRWHFGAEYHWFVPYYLDVGTGESDLV